MSVLLKKILWYPISEFGTITAYGDNIYNEAILLSENTNSSAVKGLDIKNNILQLTLANPITSLDTSGNKVYKYSDSNGNLVFNEQDKIQFWSRYTDDASDIEDAVWGSDVTQKPDNTNYLISNYYIIEHRIQRTEKGRNIILICADKNFIIFNQLHGKAYPSSGSINTAPLIIQDVIRLATQGAGADKQGDGSNPNVWYNIDAKLDTGGGEITTTRRSTREDGSTNTATSFPTLDYGATLKPVYQWIQDLSQIDYINSTTELAGDSALVYGKPFIFWLDEEDVFHWVYPDDTVIHDIIIGTSEGVISHNISKKVFDAINMVIFNAGSDMYNTGIWSYYFDPTSTAKTLKMTYKPMTDISKFLIESDEKVNATREGTPAGKPFPQFVTDVSYPITTFWNESVSTDSDYNSTLRVKAKNMGKSRAKELTSGIGRPKWKGSIVVKGAKYIAGTVIEFTDLALGANKILVRIMNVRHSYNKQQWVTTLEVEEDSLIINKLG